ncbi:MAG: glycosyltransferase [Lachnospiraceae bacterium]|nr:glycosyltransferase [Lachnospiraceae bacterium]
MKLVSVIVLAYKSAKTIAQTLDSIKNQTYQNIELIITDDGSPDHTVEETQRWLADNEGALPKMRLVTTQQNTGIPGNINRALKYAQGDYVKLIAADDYMARDAVSEYVKFCEKNPKVIPIAKVHLFSDDNAGETVDFAAVENYCKRCYEFAAQTDYKKQYRMLLKQNCIVAPSGSFYPMEIIQKLGGYDERYRWFEDYPRNLKVMHEGYRCGLIRRELIYYRISGGSITASQQMRLKKTEMKLFFRERMFYMMQAGMGWEAVKQLKYWVQIAFKR